MRTDEEAAEKDQLWYEANMEFLTEQEEKRAQMEEDVRAGRAKPAPKVGYNILSAVLVGDFVQPRKKRRAPQSAESAATADEAVQQVDQFCHIDHNQSRVSCLLIDAGTKACVQEDQLCSVGGAGTDGRACGGAFPKTAGA